MQRMHEMSNQLNIIISIKLIELGTNTETTLIVTACIYRTGKVRFLLEEK